MALFTETSTRLTYDLSKKVGQSESGAGFGFRALQLLQVSWLTEGHVSDGCWDHGSRVEYSGTHLNYMRKHRFVSAAITSGLMAQNAHYSLTTKQAEILAENAPPTLHAAQGKCCPKAHAYQVTAGSFTNPYTLISAPVRCECGPYGGQLVDNYMVNPNTGQIWEGLEEEGTPLVSKRLDSLRKQMFRQNSSPR